MMMDMFSSLDPGYSVLNQSMFFWMLIGLVFMLILSLGFSRYSIVELLMMNFLYEALDLIKKFKGMKMILMSLFFFIAMTNLSGLLPYMLSMSSHLVFTLGFGLSMWLGVVLSSCLSHASKFMISFIPEGVPLGLSFPLLLIEMISMMVRPLTLSFRLAANLSAGHVILGLVGGMMAMVKMSSIFFLFLGIGYFMFELFVALMQSYIFFLLLSLYSGEHM